ncbi:AP2-like ethylene-responsive transcription factor AIL5 [Ananas comosus]|uniref:AP2-like ethylene-responsive transcription factor AIL5 n=1 Tax=Ananas comosus TaxID=4615 RepID=A0A6P5EQ82_ANACO|nr:AP2-like ethylene-responsive transcription factor AIL5 [Ananas comosus]
MAPPNTWISFSLPPIEMLLTPYASAYASDPIVPSSHHDAASYQFLSQAMKLEDTAAAHGSPPLDPCIETLADAHDSSASFTGATDRRGYEVPYPFLLASASSEMAEEPSSVIGGAASASAGYSPESGREITVPSYPPPPPPMLAAAQPRSERSAAVGSCKRTSAYRGVTRHRWTGRYEAHLWDNTCQREGQKRKGRQVYLGGYDKEEKAARAYDLAALKYWGPTAATNFPVENYSNEIENMKDMTKQEFIASLRRKSSGFSRGASIYRGVTRHHQHGRWQARIGRVAGNKDLYLGTFATEEEAAEAYDVAAIKFRGVNAVTNFEISNYDVEAIASTDLPIGASTKRTKLAPKEDDQLASFSLIHHHPNSTPFGPIHQHPDLIPVGFFPNLFQLRASCPLSSLAYYTVGEPNLDLHS